MSEIKNDYIISDLDKHDTFIDGKMFARGLIPRDYSANPMGCYATSDPWSVDVPTIPESEWDDRIRQQEIDKSSLQHIRMRGDNGDPIKSLDQNGQGFCWAYSTAAAITILRAAANMPHVRLSPHAVAMKIYGRDRGAWGALSMDFAAANGFPSVTAWPEKSMSMNYDNDATWADAAKYKVTEGWMDLNVQAYDRNLAFGKIASALLANIPVVVDYNWWGYSVLAVRLLSNKRIVIWNSWTDSWGEMGMGILEGSKAIPDGACIARVVTGG